MSKISAEKGSTIARSESRISDDRLYSFVAWPVCIEPSREELHEMVRCYRLAMDREGLSRVILAADDESAYLTIADAVTAHLTGNEVPSNDSGAVCTTGEKGK